MLNMTNLRTVKQLATEGAPILTEGKLRWWIFHAQTNGLASALVKVGGRVYIDIKTFSEWLDGQRIG